MHLLIQSLSTHLTPEELVAGLGSAPQQYRGQIVQLSGNHLVALVSRGDGHRLSLGVSLTTDPGSGSVRGRMSAAPTEGQGNE